MKKKLIFLFILITCSTLISCTSNTTNSKTKSSTKNISINSPATSFSAPFILTNTTLYPTSFLFKDSTLIFPNWDDKNRISLLDEPLPKNYIKTTDVKNFFDYRTDSLTYSNNLVYFADNSNAYCLASLNLSNGKYIKILNTPVDQITLVNDKLFYIRKDDGYTLHSYDLTTNTESKITTDKVGKYLINNNFILYQNVTQSSKLYRISTTGTDNIQLSDYAVDSFVVYNSSIVTLNSYDSSNLYVIDSTTLKSKRLILLDAKDLKENNGKLYYLNRNTSHLNSLTVDLSTSTCNSSELYSEGINDYYPTDKYIFMKKAVNINNNYIYIIGS